MKWNIKSSIDTTKQGTNSLQTCNELVPCFWLRFAQQYAMQYAVLFWKIKPDVFFLSASLNARNQAEGCM